MSEDRVTSNTPLLAPAVRLSPQELIDDQVLKWANEYINRTQTQAPDELIRVAEWWLVQWTNATVSSGRVRFNPPHGRRELGHVLNAGLDRADELRTALRDDAPSAVRPTAAP